MVYERRSNGPSIPIAPATSSIGTAGRERRDALPGRGRHAFASAKSVPHGIAVADDCCSAAHMGADVARDRTPDHACGHAFRHVGDCDGNAPPLPENFDRVQRTGIAGTCRPQVDAAVGGSAGGQIRP